MMTDRKQKAICVLGMGRSGTSAIARAINLLGAYIGRAEQLMPPKEGNNPEGFWEHLAIVDFHERLLQTFSRFWHDPFPMPEDWWTKSEIEPYREELIDLIRREFGNCELWMWKDPRTSLVLPLWIDVLNELTIDVCYVICLRNPLDVASSLEQRDGFPQDKSLALWQIYNLSSFYWTNGSRRLVLHYDKLLEDWEPCLRKVAKTFNIPWPKNDNDLRAAVTTFLKPGLRHSLSSVDLLIGGKGVPKPVVSAYYLFIQAEQCTKFMDSKEFAEKTSRLYFDYCTYAKWMNSITERESFQTEMIQVFWPSENKFSEKNSTRADVIGDGKFHCYDLSLAAGITAPLRLDPVNFPAYVEIKSIELLIGDAGSPRSVRLVCWSQEKNFEGLRPGLNVTEMNNHETFRFISPSNDPQILLENVPSIAIREHDKRLVLRVLMSVEKQIPNGVTTVK